MNTSTFAFLVPARRLLIAAVSIWLSLAALVSAPPAHAVIGALDNVPAATLLLPYFEADLNNPNGAQTSMRVSNASASAVMLNVTLWSDWGLPTMSFGVYLTGYDTTEIDLRLVFNGHLPRTADAGSDPGDKISPKGLSSQDINFPGIAGPAAAPFTTLLPQARVQALRNAHTGVASTTFGGLCGSKAYGDGIARGYVTIDITNTGLGLDEANPSTSGYFSNFTTIQNVALGSYTVINRAQKSITTDAMVHIEASFNDPLTSTAGNPTFYSRFNGTPNNQIDYREPLASVWDARYLNGGTFSGGTKLRVWRDPVTNPVAVACGGGLPPALPLVMRKIAAFDEQENVAITPLRNLSGNTFAPLAGALSSFPLVTQSVASAPLSPFTFGFFRLDFNDSADAAPYQGGRQAHVSAVHTGAQYAVSMPGIVLVPTRNAVDTNSYP